MSLLPFDAVWLDDAHLRIGDASFVVGNIPVPVGPDELVIFKPPALVTRYLDLLADERPKRIVELGIKDGGSAAMMMVAAQPQDLLAIDLESVAPPRLTRFMDRDGADSGRLHLALGVDQADSSAVIDAVHEVFQDEQIDLVVDDASHIFAPTLASFEVLFPRLRPGAVYVIEDWCLVLAAAHLVARANPGVDRARLSERTRSVARVIQVLNDPTRELEPEVVAAITAASKAAGEVPEAKQLVELIAWAAARADLPAPNEEPIRPMADLAVGLVMAAATAPEIIAEVRVDKEWIQIRRGPADAGSFRLADLWTDLFGYLPG